MVVPGVTVGGERGLQVSDLSVEVFAEGGAILLGERGDLEDKPKHEREDGRCRGRPAEGRVQVRVGDKTFDRQRRECVLDGR